MNKNTMIKVIAGVCVVAGILSYAFWYGGDDYSYHSWSASQASVGDYGGNSDGDHGYSGSSGLEISGGYSSGGINTGNNSYESGSSDSGISDAGGLSDTGSSEDGSSPDAGTGSSDTGNSSGVGSSAAGGTAGTGTYDTGNTSDVGSSASGDASDTGSLDAGGSEDTGSLDAGGSADIGSSDAGGLAGVGSSVAGSSSGSGSSGSDEFIEPTAKPIHPTDAPDASPVVTDPAVKSCTISISCADVLDNMSSLDPAKIQLIPSDGMILDDVVVPIGDDTTVFDVLQSIATQKNIHLECSYTALYNSSYVEGIGNLYEFDCGSLSGWKYYVNGEVPSYGCSQYKVNNGDFIDFEFECDAAGDGK